MNSYLTTTNLFTFFFYDDNYVSASVVITTLSDAYSIFTASDESATVIIIGEKRKYINLQY